MRISVKLLKKKLGTVSPHLLKEVYDSGFTMREIAAQLGCSESSVSDKLKLANTEIRTSSDYKGPPKQKVNICEADLDLHVRPR